MMFFKAANKGSNKWYLYVLGFIVVFLCYVLGQIPLMSAPFVMAKFDDNITSEVINQFLNDPDFALIGLDSNIGFVILLCMFFVAFFGLILVMKYMHKRNFLSLVNYKEQLDFKKIIYAFGLWFVLGSVGEIVTYFIDPTVYSFSFNFLDFFILLIICIVLLPIQTSFEELFIRGYLMQGMALLMKNKWVPLLLSALLFGLIHGSNPEIDKYGIGIMMTYYIYAGLFLGLITIMDDSLELALGVHFATNFFGATVLGYESSAIQTSTLFKTLDMDPLIMLGMMVASSVVFYILCAKKYNWPSLKTLFEPIDYKEEVGINTQNEIA